MQTFAITKVPSHEEGTNIRNKTKLKPVSRGGRPDLADIAAALGLSVSTVSRALNGVSGVHSLTRSRVLEKAKEMGYIPHLGAKQLVGKGSRLVGVFMPEFDFEASNGFVAFFPLLQRELQRIGMDAIFFSVPLLDDLPNRLAYCFGSRGLEACIALPAFDGDHPLLRDALELGVPCINFEGVVGPRCSSVLSDDFAGGRAAALHLLEEGHRVIGHIRGPKHLRICRERYDGFCAVLREYGLDHPPELLADGDFTGAGGARAVLELLGRRPDMTAVFCANDLMAAGALQALAQNGIPVPGRVSVCGYDGDPYSGYTVPPLTTIRHSIELVTRKAVRLLQELLEGNGGRAERVLPSLLERKSVGRSFQQGTWDGERRGRNV